MNNIRFAIFLFLLIGSIIAGTISFASMPVQVISPKYNQVYHYGQQLILIAKYQPNTTATIYLTTPNGKPVPQGVYTFNSTGYLTINFGYFGSGNLVMPGNYSLEIEISGQSGVVIPFVYQPYEATVVVEVQNNQHLPIPGATVYLYNVTSGNNKLLQIETANSSGFATFHVIAFSFTQSFKVVASFPGYANESMITTVTQNQTKTVLLTLYPAILNVYVIGAMQNGLQIDPLDPVGYTYLTAIEGENITVYINTMFANTEVSNAIINVQLITPNGKNTTSSVLQIGNGTYKTTLYLPLLNVPYSALLNITAKYNSLEATATIPISVQLNYTTLEDHLESQIASLNENISKLNENITKLDNVTIQLDSALLKLSNGTATLEKTDTSLQQVTTLLNGELTNLNGEVNTLNKKLDQITPLIYIALAVGIIGTVLAVLALISIRRALS